MKLAQERKREVAALVATPGLTLLTTVGGGPIRGSHVASNGTLFVVSGNKLYSVSPSWESTEIGTLNSSKGNVSIKDNGTILVIVDGSNGYSHIFGTLNIAQITDPGFRGADQVAFQDGYFIFNKPNSGVFYISGLSSIQLDALDFASAEGLPDNIVGILSDHRELWLFGTRSTEVFYNIGDVNFPFQRIEGAFIEHGCAAPFSIAKMNNKVYWLGEDDKGSGIVFRAEGYAPSRISTHAVELAIQSYGDLNSATAYTYQKNGHHFYVLNFSSSNTTWVFDTSTNLWHERGIHK